MNKNFYYNLLRKKIINNTSIVGIIGLGYVGLPLAISFSSVKLKTTGYDIDVNKITNLKKNISYISSVSNSSLIKVNKFFNPTNDFKKLNHVDIIIVCVPTPINEKNKVPNLSYVKDVIKKLYSINLNNKLIIFECTSYPGTSEEFFLPVVQKKKLHIGKNIFLGYSPEREDPGNKKFSLDKKNIPKIVSGYTTRCLSLLNILYSKITQKTVPVSNIRTAEFTKLLENIYRSVNIGLINELTEIGNKFNIDIYECINAAKTKPFGYQAFYPGPGVGGHCIPVDPYFLSWKAKKIGGQTKFIHLAGKINDQKPEKIANKIIGLIKKKKINIKSILFLGVTYKKNCNDIRMSPIVKIIKTVKKKTKSQIYIYDTYTKLNKIPNITSLNYIDKVLGKSFLKKIDLVIIGANHDNVDYEFIANNSRLIFDLHNTFDQKRPHIIKII